MSQEWLISLIDMFAPSTYAFRKDYYSLNINKGPIPLWSLAKAADSNFATSRTIQTNQGSVFRLIRMENGEIISAGVDGVLRRWRDGKPVGKPFDTGQH